MEKYEELLISLRKTIRAIDLYSKKLSKETGLTSPQFIVLKEIASQDGIMVKDIANRINLSSATVTNILDRLENRGFVFRERSSTDKRRVDLHLTQKGQDILINAPKPLQEHFIVTFEALELWEQTQMVAIMQRMAKMMDAEEIDASPLLQVGAIDTKPSEEVKSK